VVCNLGSANIPRQVLSDVVEAVLGALFISEDCDVAAVEAFFHSVLRPFYDQHIRLNSLSSHPTAVLFKIMEASSCQDFQLKKTTSRPDAHQQDGERSLSMYRMFLGAK